MTTYNSAFKAELFNLSDRLVTECSGTATIPTDSAYDHPRVADAYADMVHDPLERGVIASYGVFLDTLAYQYVQLRKAGLSVVWQDGAGEYANSDAMLEDLWWNKSLWTRLTWQSGDAANMPTDHIMLENPFTDISRYSPVYADELPAIICWNDIFRFVHDALGHGVSAGNFSLEGEYQAWIAHRETFPDAALAALWCETRGQAAWTNAGPHMQNEQGDMLKRSDAGWIPLRDRPFAVQKNGMPPRWAV